MTNPIAYLAHPFGGDPANLDRAEAWLRWLVENVPDVDFCAPWISWCRVLTEGDYRARGLAFDCEMAKRCDLFVMVGPQRSIGMATELAAVQIENSLRRAAPLQHSDNRQILTVDLTGFSLEMVGSIGRDHFLALFQNLRRS